MTEGIEKVAGHTPDLVQSNIEAIAELFPNVVTEVATEGLGGGGYGIRRAVDFDLLRQELADHLVEGPTERYRLDWPGKRESAFAANAPEAITLRPVREESVDFDTTQNLFIEGDNLQALKLLQDSYFGKVKLIYIDPPYNTGNDFIYDDDFAESSAEYLERSGQVDEAGGRLVTNTESNGRFHSDWLSMMYPRLKLARNLLSDDGVIFVSIGDDEVGSLRLVCADVFGESNFIGQLVWEKKKKGAFLSGAVSNVKEYVLCFARNRWSFPGLIGEIARNPETYPVIKTTNSRGVRTIRSGIESKFAERNHVVSSGSRITAGNQEMVLLSDLRIVDGLLADDVVVESNWIYSQELLDEFAADGVLYVTQDLYFRRIVTHPRTKVMRDLLTMRGSEGSGARFWLTDDLSTDGWGTNEDGFDELHALFGQQNLMSFPKPSKLIAKLITAACRNDKQALVVDFFAGSGTTADALMQVNAADSGNRRFIMVQLDEQTPDDSAAKEAGFDDIAQLSRERIRRAGAKIKDEAGLNADSLDVGFRTLRVDSTSYRDVRLTPDETEQTALEMLADNIKADRTPEDLLFEVMIDWGLELSLPIERAQVEGADVFLVEGNFLVGCFDHEVSDAVIRAIAERKPTYAVFRDSSFASDDAQINARQIFTEVSPDTQLKVI